MDAEQFNKVLHASEGWPKPANSAAYHGLAGEIIERIEPHTEADPDVMLSVFLIQFGNLIGRRPHILLSRQKHHANNYLGVIGSSGARKGTSVEEVRNVFNQVDDFQWLGRCVRQGGLSSGEGLISHFEPKDDGKIPDRRLLINESEFARVLKVMNREGNILSEVMRGFWENGSASIMTRKN